MKKIPKLSFKTPLFRQKSRHWQRAGLSNLILFETGISEFLISLVVMVRKKGAKNSGRDPFNQNSNRSDRENWSTSKGGPVFSKLFRLDRADQLSFGPKFPEVLVEWIAPSELSERLGRIKGRDRIASIFELCSSSSYSTSFFNKEPRPRLFRLLVCGKGGHLYHTDWTSR